MNIPAAAEESRQGDEEPKFKSCCGKRVYLEKSDPILYCLSKYLEKSDQYYSSLSWNDLCIPGRPVQVSQAGGKETISRV